MDKENNFSHWQNLANQYGANLHATTKCNSIKTLEIEALTFAIKKYADIQPISPSVIMEFGCGIGTNLIEIQKCFPNQYYIGFDFVNEMTENAKRLADQTLDAEARKKLFYGQIDIRNLSNLSSFLKYLQSTIEIPPHVLNLLSNGASIIITDRCIINLQNHHEQMEAIKSIRSLLHPEGFYLMLENSIQSNNRLNIIRKELGLDSKKIAEFNTFIDEIKMEAYFKNNRYLEVIDFAGLHDMMLYGVDAALNNGKHSYDTAFMEKIALLNKLLINNDIQLPFGQNRLWIWSALCNEY